MAKYVAFSAYYKHGEVMAESLNNDAEMREYCEEKLEDYGMGNVATSEWSLEDLIKYTVEQGRGIVDRQMGWGVMHIFKGSNIIEVGDLDKIS